MTERIAFQGEFGSNSHMACAEAFSSWQAVPCQTFEEALGCVQESKADLAMIPIENTVAGRVADVHHLLPRSTLSIVGEHFLRIEHCLMALPGATLDRIEAVYSHIHALGQCREFITKHGLRGVVASDTAGSARAVQESGDLRRAAIAPKLAAQLYGLSILASSIEDEDHNTTRFVVLAREPDYPDAKLDCVTTLLFKVRNIPSALYKALGGFATNKLNMTRIESYMLDGQFNNTMFLVDVAVHTADERFALALEELSFFAKDVKVLGCYPAHWHRSRLTQEAS